MDRKTAQRGACAWLTGVLLSLCLFAALAASLRAGAEADTVRTVRAGSVDEMLSAIAPDTLIELDGVDFSLADASDYGLESESPYYSWSVQYDWNDEGQYVSGAELNVHGVSNLTVRGAGAADTRVLAEPRFANVLVFTDCANISLEGLTLGHTPAGECSGGAVRLAGCTDVFFRGCGLFGSGTVGVQAVNCVRVRVLDSAVYECSLSAADAFCCRDFLVRGCDVYSVKGQGMPASALFSARSCDGFTVCDSRVHENDAVELMHLEDVENAFFLSNMVYGNRCEGAAFLSANCRVLIGGCGFTGNDFPEWFKADLQAPILPGGEELSAEALENMRYADISPEEAERSLETEDTVAVPPGGTVRVRDMRELMLAIGPERTVVLESGAYDTASVSGMADTQYCAFVGGTLNVTMADGLTLTGAQYEARCSVLFSSAQSGPAICFRDCEGLTLSGLCFGSENEPGRGTLVSLVYCSGSSVCDCVFQNAQTGICLQQSVSFYANGLEFASFGEYAFDSQDSDSLAFLNCRAAVGASPCLRFLYTGDKTWNGAPLGGNGEYVLTVDGELKAK